MKLLFFISSLRSGGAERVFSTVVNGLVKRGYQITIVYDQQLPRQYAIDERIHQMDLYSLIPQRTNAICRNLRFCMNIRRLTKQINPNVVISFMFSLNTIVLLSLLFSDYPVIASEHTRFQNLKESNLRYYISRYWVNKLAKKVTVLTLRDYNFIGNRLSNKVVLPNPLSFPPIKRVASRPNKILACGSLDRYQEKGFDSLIEVFGKIALKYPHWTLDILGAGSDVSKKFLNELIRKSGAENKIKLLGYSSDVASVMQKYSIFVLSSRFEGFSMVLVEAMSQGCACVSYDCVAGPREIITHNVDGLLIEDQNESKLQEGLEYLIGHPEQRIKLAQNAIHSVERFSKKKILDKWEDLLEQCSKGDILQN